MNPTRLTADQLAALRWRRARAAAAAFAWIDNAISRYILGPGGVFADHGYWEAYTRADAEAIWPLIAEEGKAEDALIDRLSVLGEPIATPDGREVYLNGLGHVRERSSWPTADTVEFCRRPSVPAKG